MMRTKLGMVVGAVGALALVPAMGRAAIMVDDFSDKQGGNWPFVRTDNAAPVTGFIEGPLSGVLGGEREAVLSSSLITVTGYDSVRADVFTGGGYSFLDYTSSSGAQGKLQLMYGEAAFASFPGGGVTHTADADAIRVTFLAVDVAGGQPLTINSFAFTGGVQTNLPAVQVTSPGAQYVDIPLASYWSGHSVLNGLSLSFTGGVGADYRIDSITLVPEPGMAAGLAVAAGAMALRRKRA